MTPHPRRTAVRMAAVCLLLTTIVITAGCSTKHYRESADKEVYHILKHRRKGELGQTESFTIDRKRYDPLQKLERRHQPLLPPGAADSEIDLGDAPESSPPAIISFVSAIEIAIRNSRDYQDQKEGVYLDTLDLTLERHQWSPTFTAIISGRWQRVNRDESWVGNGDFGFSQMLATGGTIALGFGSTFLKFMTGPDGHASSSTVTLDFVQPLWRGAGERIAQENLKQSERDVIYTIRSFARFHKTFAVSIATAYYRVLRQRDVVRNEWNNYQRLRSSTNRAAEMAQAGRLPEFQVDQARQDELAAKDRFIRSVQDYQQQLDAFKIDLGLATDANVDVDARDLARLATTGILHPTIAADGAVSQALQLRLDLITAEDQVADAKRKVVVAKNGLRPDVDLVVSAGVPTENNKPARFRTRDGSYSAGLDVDLPLDRKAERNTYRRSLISLERQKRNAAELADNVKLQVRQAWRTLEEAKESYEIQRMSLDLARRRVESTELLQQAGRASTRDLLEAQRALLEAQNALTRALVDHTIAKLQLWRDIGTLVVNKSYELEVEKLEHSRTPPQNG